MEQTLVRPGWCDYLELTTPRVVVLIMFAVTLLPFATRLSGPLYLAGAVVLGGGFIWRAGVLLWGSDPKAAMATFRYSIIYLMALFMVMLLDYYLFPMSAS